MGTASVKHACVTECDWLAKYGNYHDSCVSCQRLCKQHTVARAQRAGNNEC